MGKQFVHDEFKDHESVYGYMKKRADVYLVEEGSETGARNYVGYLKTEPILGPDGTSLQGEVVYFRSRGFSLPKGQPLYFESVRAAMTSLQKAYDAASHTEQKLISGGSSSEDLSDAIESDYDQFDA